MRSVHVDASLFDNHCGPSKLVPELQKLPRHGSGRTLHKAASGLLQRGGSASTLTGKTMSFVLRQKKVQEKQIANIERKGSRRSNGSSDEEYCRTISSDNDVDDELSKFSDAEDDMVQ